MELLIYGNRKQDDQIWDVSTPKKRREAFLALFKILRDDWQVYEGGDLRVSEQKLLLKAGLDDAEAAEKLLTGRRGYEYEEWHFAETEN
jgi:hypothetical protein